LSSDSQLKGFASTATTARECLIVLLRHFVVVCTLLRLILLLLFFWRRGNDYYNLNSEFLEKFQFGSAIAAVMAEAKICCARQECKIGRNSVVALSSMLSLFYSAHINSQEYFKLA